MIAYDKYLMLLLEDYVHMFMLNDIAGSSSIQTRKMSAKLPTLRWQSATLFSSEDFVISSLT